MCVCVCVYGEGLECLMFHSVRLAPWGAKASNAEARIADSRSSVAPDALLLETGMKRTSRHCLQGIRNDGQVSGPVLRRFFSLNTVQWGYGTRKRKMGDSIDVGPTVRLAGIKANKANTKEEALSKGTYDRCRK